MLTQPHVSRVPTGQKKLPQYCIPFHKLASIFSEAVFFYDWVLPVHGHRYWMLPVFLQQTLIYTKTTSTLLAISWRLYVKVAKRSLVNVLHSNFFLR